jgi:[glutamine synthetase] adenylyltransferase / [glutamine synthetase]-adenylyl-L-tyrosine phosphorylase
MGRLVSRVHDAGDESRAVVGPATMLDDPNAARSWLASLGVRDTDRGLRDLRDLRRRGGSAESFAEILEQLAALLPACPDAGMALTNLDRFVAAAPDGAAMLNALGANPRTTEILVQLLSTSQYFSELLIRDTSSLDWLRAGAARHDRDGLIDELWKRIPDAPDDESARQAIRRFRHLEMLRIGYNDIVRELPLEITTLDLSHLADACVEAACRIARGHTIERFGEPRSRDGRRSRFVVLGLGKLGGAELNYSSDIDLVFLYDEDGQTDGPRPVTNAEFFVRMGGEVVRLLADHTSLGVAYRVDMRLRPEGAQGPLARSLKSALGYYETSGRTWERQALIKCRPVAGDLDLGANFLSAISPFVYRRYLSGAEIAEIKTMKRRIESRTKAQGTDEVEVKTGRGGIRDVEFVVQFLQLLHGGTYPSVREGNTLLGIARLEEAGCLTADERTVMEDTYRFLRGVEHRLQTMFDRQTHQMPRDPEAQRTLAIRLGYPPRGPWEDRVGPTSRFLSDYRSKTENNRSILNHLLHDAFLSADSEGPADPIVDLVLDPEPSPEMIREALEPHRFRDRETAHRNLLALAREDHEFLSHARCRHFLAAIAPSLLKALGRAPDPDQALTTLEKVSASLGAKAVLWELFSFNPPSLRLFVDLCATSPFLSEILINSPGMIDDLIDSLVVDRPQPASAIRAELSELCHGAEDLAPILTGFRNKEWVRIGTRDILGREPIRTVTRELSDVAEGIVAHVARDQYRRRVDRLGVPHRADTGHKSRLAILGVGKLGGRELNYHSDLDLIFLYDAEGETRGHGGPAPNSRFFTEICQRILKALAGTAEWGALYAADTRLRPHGSSGPLAIPLEAWTTYCLESAQTWERMSLTRGRVVFAQGDFGKDVAAALHRVLCLPIDHTELARAVVAMRRKLEDSRAPRDLKRGAGGLVDIEFIVQYLQLAHASTTPEVLKPNTWEALDALRKCGVLSTAIARELRDAYDNLRTIESRLRIAHNRGGVDLPEDPAELARLARRLNYAGDDDAAATQFRTDVARYTARVRELFDHVVGSRAALEDDNK